MLKKIIKVALLLLALFPERYITTPTTVTTTTTTTTTTTGTGMGAVVSPAPGGPSSAAVNVGKALLVRSKVVAICEWKTKEPGHPLLNIELTKEADSDVVAIRSVTKPDFRGKAKIATKAKACSDVKNQVKEQGVICVYDQILEYETGKPLADSTGTFGHKFRGAECKLTPYAEVTSTAIEAEELQQKNEEADGLPVANSQVLVAVPQHLPVATEGGSSQRKEQDKMAAEPPAESSSNMATNKVTPHPPKVTDGTAQPQQSQKDQEEDAVTSLPPSTSAQSAAKEKEEQSTAMSVAPRTPRPLQDALQVDAHQQAAADVKAEANANGAPLERADGEQKKEQETEAEAVNPATVVNPDLAAKTDGIPEQEAVVSNLPPATEGNCEIEEQTVEGAPADFAQIKGQSDRGGTCKTKEKLFVEMCKGNLSCFSTKGHSICKQNMHCVNYRCEWQKGKGQNGDFCVKNCECQSGRCGDEKDVGESTWHSWKRTCLATVAEMRYQEQVRERQQAEHDAYARADARFKGGSDEDESD